MGSRGCRNSWQSGLPGRKQIMQTIEPSPTDIWVVRKKERINTGNESSAHDS